MNSSLYSRLFRKLAVSALLGTAVFASSAAQAAYPEPGKSIRLIIPFAPGGVTDTSGRLVAEYLSKKLGTQVVAENRPGASGNIGTNAVMNAAPDGYTLMLTLDGSLVINPHVMSSMANFNPTKNLAPVGLIGNSTVLLVAHPSLNARTLTEVLEIAKNTPEGLSYGTSGAGSIVHIIGELLNQKTNAKLMHVPYKGGAPAVNDVVAGHIPLAFVSAASVKGYIDQGKLIPIAVPTGKRSPFFPEVKTFVENNVPDFDVGSWVGLLAPAGTPDDVIKKLNEELNAVLRDPEVIARLNGMGIEPVPGTPEDFAKRIDSNYILFGDVVKNAGITLN